MDDGSGGHHKIFGPGHFGWFGRCGSIDFRYPLIQGQIHDLIAVRVERPSGDVIVLSEGEDGSGH